MGFWRPSGRILLVALAAAAPGWIGCRDKADQPAASPVITPEPSPPPGRGEALSGTWERGSVKCADGKAEATVRIILRWENGEGSGTIRAERRGDVLGPGIPAAGTAEVTEPFTFSLGQRDGREVIVAVSESGRHMIAFEVRGDTLRLEGKYPLSGLFGELDLQGDWKRVPRSGEPKGQ
jgi:hypothetical protein